MRERVLAIVSLIAQYVLKTEDVPVSEKELVAELISAGFAAEEIDDAFTWMETIAFSSAVVPDDPARLLQDPGYRIFTAREQQLLTLDARGFLIRVRAMGLFPEPLQEEIIDRAIRTAEDPVTEQEVKLITALTLLLRSNVIWLREIDCLLDNDWKRIYH